jgi:hypothetical protein
MAAEVHSEGGLEKDVSHERGCSDAEVDHLRRSGSIMIFKVRKVYFYCVTFWDAHSPQ